MGDSQDALRDLPRAARIAIGRALNVAQWGGKAPYAKVLSGFGSANLQEVRVDDQGDTFRAIYTVEFRASVYVLHVFKKKSKHGIGMPKPDRELLELRLKQARHHHQAASERGQ